jgi:hypothetical protein
MSGAHESERARLHLGERGSNLKRAELFVIAELDVSGHLVEAQRPAKQLPTQLRFGNPQLRRPPSGP